MKVKWMTIIVSIILIIALLSGCGIQPLEENTVTTTTSPIVESTTTADTPLAIKPTADCVRTTPVNWAPTTNRTLSPPTNAASTSDSTVSTTVSTTDTTVSPTVHILTPLASSSYYGLSQLKNLPNGAGLATVYEKLALAVSNCQTTILLDETLTADEVVTAFYYYRADYPQHFWCDGQLGYAVSERSNMVVRITLQYTMTGEKLRQAQTDFQKAVIDFLNIAATGNDEYERELLLHDALAKRITYRNGKNAHNAYGALVEGEAVCEGYARAFQYLLYQSGIQCLIAEGSSINPSTGVSEGHAWNVVRIGGLYYHVDLTWDDTDDTQTPVMYPYFNLTTAQIGEDHAIRSEKSYSLPNCVATAANFHVRNGTRLTEPTVDSVAAILKSKTGSAHLYCVKGSTAFVKWFGENHKAVVQAMGINRGYSYSMLYTGKEVVIRLTVR